MKQKEELSKRKVDTALEINDGKNPSFIPNDIQNI
jgi:hypothetical protein